MEEFELRSAQFSNRFADWVLSKNDMAKIAIFGLGIGGFSGLTILMMYFIGTL